MNIGDRVYAVCAGVDREGVYEYTLVEFGTERLILQDKDEGYGQFKRPGRLLSFRRDHVFATKKEAEVYLNGMQPQVGDYVAVINYTTLTHGLVVKITPKMVEILLSNEEDIARNGGKMKSRHHKYNVVTLIRNGRQ